MRYAVYARLSKGKGEDDTTIARQIEICRQEHIEPRNGEVAAVYTDVDRSASKIEVHREDFTRLLAAMKAGHFDAVVTYRMDRLLRHWGDAGTFWLAQQHSGIHLFSVRDGFDSTSPMAPMLFGVSVGSANNETTTLGQRVRDKLAENASAGRNHASIRPFGYGRLIRDEANNEIWHPSDRDSVYEPEAAIVREIYCRFDQGESVHAITLDLRQRGITGTRGKPISRQVIARILESERYTGIRTHKGERINSEASWPAIVDRSLWERVNRKRQREAKTYQTSERRPRSHVLVNLLQCSCGNPMSSKPFRGKRRYICKGGAEGHGCGKVSVMADGAEAILSAMLLAEVADPSVRAQIAQIATHDQDGRDVGASLEALEARNHELFALYQAHIIDAVELASERAAIKIEIHALRDRLSTDEGAGRLLGLPADPAELAAQWAGFTMDQKRALYRAATKKMVVKPAKRGPRMTAERFDIEWRW